MKLLYCMKCGDVFNLTKEVKTCSCGESSGMYQEDGYHAQYSGWCVPLGFSNPSFRYATAMWHTEDAGENFIAFTIDPHCATFVPILEKGD